MAVECGVDNNTNLQAHKSEVQRGDRFQFGANWAKFLSTLDENRIQIAVDSLKLMLEVDNLKGRSFLDVGSGSGLFSLAARRLGAKVYSFDYDPKSVACTLELKCHYFDRDDNWTIEEGSVLDEAFMESLGKYDIVYSWGVLHHTGEMWKALANVEKNVAPGGKLFIALYNDQGGGSRRWLRVKKIYNKLPRMLRAPYAVIVFLPSEMKAMVAQILRGTPMAYFRNIAQYEVKRGMNWWYDKIDWIGGLPFEVSKPEQIFAFYRKHGFQLDTLRTCAGGLGCNQYVFARDENSRHSRVRAGDRSESEIAE